MRWLQSGHRQHSLQTRWLLPSPSGTKSRNYWRIFLTWKLVMKEIFSRQSWINFFLSLFATAVKSRFPPSFLVTRIQSPETNKCSQEYHVACNHAKAKKIPVKFLPFIHAQQTKGNSRGAITVMDIMAADLSALDYFNWWLRRRRTAIVWSFMDIIVARGLKWIICQHHCSWEAVAGCWMVESVKSLSGANDVKRCEMRHTIYG